MFHYFNKSLLIIMHTQSMYEFLTLDEVMNSKQINAPFLSSTFSLWNNFRKKFWCTFLRKKVVKTKIFATTWEVIPMGKYLMFSLVFFLTEKKYF